MPESQTPDQCSKQALFLDRVSPDHSAWIAFGTMIPMLMCSGIIIFVTIISHGKPVSQQRPRFLVATLLSIVVAVLAFPLNLAFRHMQYCGPASPTPGIVGVLSVWTGDITALGVLIAWLSGLIDLLKTWRNERKRRTDLAARGRIKTQELHDLSAGKMANGKSSSPGRVNRSRSSTQ